MDIVVFDLDGTIANIDHRRHLVDGKDKDWDKFYRQCVNDKPNNRVIELLSILYYRDKNVQIWSGRSDVVRQPTEIWLNKYVVPYNGLLMRKDGDYTPDEVLKENWLKETISKGFTVSMVFDDRKKVVDMWRRNGIQCFQVADGDF